MVNMPNFEKYHFQMKICPIYYDYVNDNDCLLTRAHVDYYLIQWMFAVVVQQQGMILRVFDWDWRKNYYIQQYVYWEKIVEEYR